MRSSLLSRPQRDRLVAALPRWLVEKVPRDHWEPPRVLSHRRHVVAGVSVVGAGLLGLSLAAEPGSKRFIALSLGVAGTWLAGGLLSGPLHLGFMADGEDRLKRPVVTPVVIGAAAFGAFYGFALVARHIPVLNDAIASVLLHADEGTKGLVLFSALANGAAEEVFFRGALYAAFGSDRPAIVSTVVYTVATVATRNPALVLAAAFMGSLFGAQRRSSGGIQAPVLTHLTWSVLMFRFMPPLFRTPPAGR